MSFLKLPSLTDIYAQRTTQVSTSYHKGWETAVHRIDQIRKAFFPCLAKIFYVMTCCFNKSIARKITDNQKRASIVEGIIRNIIKADRKTFIRIKISQRSYDCPFPGTNPFRDLKGLTTEYTNNLQTTLEKPYRAYEKSIKINTLTTKHITKVKKIVQCLAENIIKTLKKTESNSYPLLDNIQQFTASLTWQKDQLVTLLWNTPIADLKIFDHNVYQNSDYQKHSSWLSHSNIFRYIKIHAVKQNFDAAVYIDEINTMLSNLAKNPIAFCFEKPIDLHKKIAPQIGEEVTRQITVVENKIKAALNTKLDKPRPQPRQSSRKEKLDLLKDVGRKISNKLLSNDLNEYPRCWFLKRSPPP